MYKQAVSALRKGNDELAFLKFTHINEYYPDSRYREESLFRIGEYYFKHKNVRDSQQFLDEYLRTFPVGKFAAKAAEYVGLFQVQTLMQVASKAYDSRDFYAAFSDYEEILRVDPGNGGAKVRIQDCRNNLVQLFLSQAQAAFSSQEYDKAIKAYEQILEFEPDNDFVKEKIAKCQVGIEFERQQIAKGLVKFRGKWVKPEQRDATLHKEEGERYFNAGDWTSAISSFDEALKLEPGWKFLGYNIDDCKAKLDFEAGQKAKGLVKYDGQRVPVEEKNRLVVDLKKGYFGSLRINEYVDIDKIVRIIGTRPQKSEDNIFNVSHEYPGKGLKIIIEENKILDLTLYLKNDDQVNDNYSSFGGDIRDVSDNETVETIVTKFGSDYEGGKAYLGNNYIMDYRMGYGNLSFIFDKNNRLIKISLSAYH